MSEEIKKKIEEKYPENPHDVPTNRIFNRSMRHGMEQGYQLVEQELTSLREENERLKSVMIAAAEEIQEHWQAHCDEEGYGPANLMRRLEKGIPSQYGYTAGAFAKLTEELTRAKELLKRSDDQISYLKAYGANGITVNLQQEIETFLTPTGGIAGDIRV